MHTNIIDVIYPLSHYCYTHAVIQIDPMLHGVRPLIEELNEKSNFGQFCKHIRQKFQELCSKPVKPTQD